MLSVDDVFKGWYEDTDRAWKALDQSTIRKLNQT
jgi:hypothetical protein